MTLAQAVGTAVATFTAEEAALFVDSFERAWCMPIDAEQRRAIGATIVYVAAYCARCEHDLGRPGWFYDALPGFARALA